MRLRYQFLALVVALLIGVVGGSFYWLYSDLRREFVGNLNASLDTSVSLFKEGENQRFDTLQLLVSSLEASPGFRNVLRRTDRETLIDFVDELNQSMSVDLVIITDAEGQLVLRTDDTSKTEGQPFENTTLEAALEGYAVRDYWALDSGLYQGVTLPLADSRGYIEGSVTLAYRMDKSFLDGLRRKLGTQVSFEVGEHVLGQRLPEQEYLSRTVALGSNSEQSQGSVTLQRSLRPVQEFVVRSQGRLVALGGGAFLIALLVSIPLIGKITNPVEMLAQAQAEMETIFKSNPDGLVALDERGRITNLNPASTLALGAEVEALLGEQLSDVLPEHAYSELMGAPPGLVQRAEFKREGRAYRLSRTFIRRAQTEDLGSILLIQDTSQEQERERRLDDFLEGLEETLCQPSAPFPVRLALQNLIVWSHDKSGKLKPGHQRVSVSKLLTDCQNLDLGDDQCPLLVEACEDSLDIEGDAAQLRLALENVIWNSVSHGEGEVSLRCRRDGGACEIRISDQGPGVPADILENLAKSPGLGIPLTRRILEQHRGRLDVDEGALCLKLPLLPAEMTGD